MAKEKNLPDVDQGSSFLWIINVKDPANTLLALNLNGYTCRASARDNYGDLLPAFEFVCTVTDDANGIIEVVAADDVLAAVTAGKYYYDVKLDDPLGKTFTLYRGFIQLLAEVTAV